MNIVEWARGCHVSAQGPADRNQARTATPTGGQQDRRGCRAKPCAAANAESGKMFPSRVADTRGGEFKKRGRLYSCRASGQHGRFEMTFLSPCLSDVRLNDRFCHALTSRAA